MRLWAKMSENRLTYAVHKLPGFEKFQAYYKKVVEWNAQTFSQSCWDVECRGSS